MICISELLYVWAVKSKKKSDTFNLLYYVDNDIMI